MSVEMSAKAVVYNVDDWIKKNEKYFLPPVCNKMMHGDGQMKLFFVGGPNQRKDYHMECGEELFYQKKGDMILKVVERGVHKDVHIKEGQMFLLPCRVQHSPQRFQDTLGLVIERERRLHEKDGLRYFVEDDGKPSMTPLYEKWFYCSDLGTQLAPIIKGFFESEEYKTGKPTPGSVADNPPLALDHDVSLGEPFDFKDWLDSKKDELENSGKVPVFDPDNFQFSVYVFGRGENTGSHSQAEVWLWQLNGESRVELEGELFNLGQNDTILIPKSQTYTVRQEAGSRCLVVWQDPTRASTWLPPN